MCGIFAYSGKKSSIPVLLKGLEKLEYRGYDSAGILCINNKNKNIFFEKSIGKVINLKTLVKKNEPSDMNHYTSGIAHTRWATHGAVTLNNTHPHHSSDMRYFIVHNGIIENYKELKKELIEKGFKFYSDTDTEVVVKLIESSTQINLEEKIEEITAKIIGAYAICIIDTEKPEKIVATKLGSPMILGIEANGVCISSDISALTQESTDFITMDDNEICVINSGKYDIYSLGHKVEKTKKQIDIKSQKIEKGKFETFTEKEIHETPDVIKNVFKGRINFETKQIKSKTLDKVLGLSFEKIEIIASGSSYFAGVVGATWFKELGNIKCEVKISSEFLYDKFMHDGKILYIFLSQSGETADVRESVKLVKNAGATTFGIVNSVGSTIANMCDYGLYTHSGIEIGVASTKNIIGQLGVLLLMAIKFGEKRGLQERDSRLLIDEISKLEETFKYQLDNLDKIDKIVLKYSKYNNFFFLGRNLLYGTASECSLKFKELTYLHAESYSTGELKHGPLALINSNMPSIIINPESELSYKTESNVEEIKARGGVTLGIITKGMDESMYDDVILLPKSHKLLAPFIALIPMWTLSVKVAKLLGKDIDKPQNLAKSVTVE